MKLYVLRHGETEGNVKNIMHGRYDALLNENGIKEAEKNRDNIRDKNINIDLIISSTLKRALKTAQIVSNGEIPIIEDDRLLSRDHGEFEGMNRNQIDIRTYWNYEINKIYESAENIRAIYNRVNDLLNEIKIKYPDKTILLVTHSGVCRVIYYIVNGIPKDGDMLSGYEAKTGLLEEYDI